MASPAEQRRIGLVVARSTTEADGIRDYTHTLLRMMREAALDAHLFEWADGALRTGSGNAPAEIPAAELESLDAIVLQYNPFSFGRWGFAPELPRFLARLRLKRRRPLIAVMFHETFVDMRNLRWTLMGGWQRMQLLAVQATADVQLCSIQRWTERLRKTAFGRPVHHLPVASNLPDARPARHQARAALGADADTLVLACMGLRHHGRLAGHVLGAAREAGKAERSVLLLDLGPGERSVERLAGNVALRATGFLDVDDLGAHVAASDVFLAPYRDGVSTRRTTVMAALQHGVPVVGTTGHLTDDLFAGAPGLVLVDRNRPDRFAAAVTSLARDPARRAQLGMAGRRLYATDFDWPVLVRRLRTHLNV